MKKAISLTVLVGALMVASHGYSYTGSFTEDFDAAGSTDWTDPVNTGTVIVTGETTPADSPAYFPAPNDVSAGFNGTGWMRVGTTNAGNFGVVLSIFDANTTVPAEELEDYTIEVDMFVVVDQPTRHQLGLAGHWTPAAENSPPEFFYSHNTPANPNGFGWRGGGLATQYGAFGGVTLDTNQWVRIRMDFFENGTRVEVGVDIGIDGIEEHSQEATYTGTGLTRTSGAAGVFAVLNDPSASSSAVTSLYSYFDNFELTFPSSVNDWTLF
ncbi:MAG: hypothetical protein JJU11_16030 [Candidatus Sumerlaeia bacterium]|nr:hypothetical protein [Candidatus Sumerlaeia bacterium]